MPARFIAAPSAGAFSVVRWVVPGFTIVLLAALLASAPEGRMAQSFGWVEDRVRVTRRWLTLAMIGIVSAANRCVDSVAHPPVVERSYSERPNTAARSSRTTGILRLAAVDLNVGTDVASASAQWERPQCR